MKQLLATIVAVYLNIYYEHRFTVYGSDHRLHRVLALIGK